METIKNEMEERTEVVPYTVPGGLIDVDSEFIGSDSLEELEEGIKTVGQAADVMALLAGVAIIKIESEGLWLQAGYPNLRAYRIAQAERLDMPRSTISNRRATAEVWLKYHKELGKMSLAGKVSSLTFFEEGVKAHGLKDTIASLKKMSFREFREWAAPRAIESDDLPEVDFSIRKGELVVDGVTVAKLVEDIPEQEKDFFSSVMRKAYAARKGNMVPYVLPVYDQGEARAVENFLKKHRAER